MPQSPTWIGRVFLDAGTILYIGPGGTADRHAHHAVQLLWSATGPFTVTTARSRVQRHAVLMPAQEVHELDANGHTIALLLIEPHGVRGTRMNEHARAARGREHKDTLAALAFPRTDFAASDATGWIQDALALFGTLERAPISSVSRRAIQFIERTLDGVPRLDDAAATLGLSPTRLTHVFSAEVGIPFRRFVLWTRIKRAVAAFQARNDLTASAIAAGFSDAAHFSRTFRSMFGLSPSLVLPIAQITGTIWE